jgi:hypothetical protein
MFRGGRDWPVACNEISDLILASTLMAFTQDSSPHRE